MTAANITTVSDQDYILGLFEDGLVPTDVSNDRAVPDFAFYDDIVYSAEDVTLN